MFSGATIRSISDHAAYRAAQDERVPLYIWGPSDIKHLPFLGSYVPAGWRELEELQVMADSSGFDSPDEPALTMPQLEAYIKEHPGLGWASV